jgi:hypothetical protein
MRLVRTYSNYLGEYVLWTGSCKVVQETKTATELLKWLEKYPLYRGWTAEEDSLFLIKETDDSYLVFNSRTETYISDIRIARHNGMYEMDSIPIG